MLLPPREREERKKRREGGKKRIESSRRRLYRKSTAGPTFAGPRVAIRFAFCNPQAGANVSQCAALLPAEKRKKKPATLILPDNQSMRRSEPNKLRPVAAFLHLVPFHLLNSALAVKRRQQHQPQQNK